MKKKINIIQRYGVDIQNQMQMNPLENKFLCKFMDVL